MRGALEAEAASAGDAALTRSHDNSGGSGSGVGDDRGLSGSVHFAASGRGARLRLEGLSLWSAGVVHGGLLPEAKAVRLPCGALAAAALRCGRVAGADRARWAAKGAAGESAAAGQPRCCCSVGASASASASSSSSSCGGLGCVMCALGPLTQALLGRVDLGAGAAHPLAPQPGAVLLAVGGGRCEVERCRWVYQEEIGGSFKVLSNGEGPGIGRRWCWGHGVAQVGGVEGLSG